MHKTHQKGSGKIGLVTCLGLFSPEHTAFTWSSIQFIATVTLYMFT